MSSFERLLLSENNNGRDAGSKVMAVRFCRINASNLLCLVLCVKECLNLRYNMNKCTCTVSCQHTGICIVFPIMMTVADKEYWQYSMWWHVLLVLTVEYVMTRIVSTDSTVCGDIYCTVDTNNTVCGDTHTHTHTPQHHQLSETPRIAAGCNTPIIYENRGNIWALKIKKIVRRLRNFSRI